MSNPLPSSLPIQPFTRPVRGSVTLPGSKSITNRALLLAALCDQPVALTGALFSDDTRLMVGALRKLGFTVHADEAASTLRVSDQVKGFTVGEADLQVGLAGTAARFLTALCAAAPQGRYRLDGVPRMRKRPMTGLIGALRALGADIRCTGEEGFLPLEIHAQGLRGGPVTLDARESSQMLSALLMVAPLASAPITISVFENSVRWPFVQMSLNMMRRFGHTAVSAQHEPLAIRVIPARHYLLSAGEFHVESDATAASYFIALPMVTDGQLTISDYHFVLPLQGDIQYAQLLQREGLIQGINEHRAIHTIQKGPAGKGVTADFSTFSDTFLTLAAIAPLLDGPTKITGIAHTRKQETDRVAGMARELKKLGQHVIETEDSLEIHPRPLVPDVEIETYHDHRFAMSFAILGCHDLLKNGRPWLTIKDPACCAKTFPDFFAVLENLRCNSSAP
jgi:3-phosphoshikimate 1-carboxyvinyltransferase